MTPAASTFRPMGSSVARESWGGGRDALRDLIAKKSFGRGKITLSSGRESSFYFDMKPLMLDPDGASMIAEQILTEVVGAGAKFVGGLEIGALPITGAVCLHSARQGTPVHGFFVRKKPKEHGAKKLIEGLPPHESLEGQRVAVVDDVTTSGESALKAIAACEHEGAVIVLVISIVDREEGAAEVFAKKDIKFTSLYKASEFLNAK
jgi:orotate phosphoribosyltransferase